MNIDLVLLCLVALFAVLGAVSGASRQLANLGALVLAYAAAYPGGKLLGPILGAQLRSIPGGLDIIAATIVVFTVVLVAGRVLLGAVLKRLFSGKDDASRGVDRTLGFLMGGAKVVLVAYVLLCALTFVEDNVTVAGKQLGLSPKDSVSFGLARRFNLFELTHFSALKDFAEVAGAATDPKRQKDLKHNESWQELRRDPRFQKALQSRALRAALREGDHRMLLRHDAVGELMADREFAQKLRKAAVALQAE